MQWVLQQAPEDARQVLLVVGHSLALGPCTPTQSLHRQLPVVCSRSAVILHLQSRLSMYCACCSCASAGDMQDLLRAVESAKQRLSERDQTSISVPDFGGSRGLDVPVTRRDFEEATAPLLSRLWPPLKELGSQACVAWASR